MFEARRWASSLMAGVLAAQLIPVLPARALTATDFSLAERLLAWLQSVYGATHDFGPNRQSLTLSGLGPRTVSKGMQEWDAPGECLRAPLPAEPTAPDKYDTCSIF